MENLEVNKIKEVTIHLGLHRTGTTFLQKEIFEKLKINYIFDDAIHRIKMKDGINLISNEGLSLSMPHSLTHRLQILDHLQKLFPNARILIGLRERETWLRSCYYRYILSRGTLTYQEYLEKYANNILDFDSYLKEIQKRFGEIYIYHFEDLKRKPDYTIKKICDFIDVEIPRYKLTKRNASLKMNQLNVLRQLNKLNFGPIVIPIIKFIQRTPT